MNLDEVFRFKIGDHVTMPDLIDNHEGKCSPPQRLIVLTRNLEECHGGIQLHYDVRPLQVTFGQTGFSLPMRVYDFELVAYPKVPA